METTMIIKVGQERLKAVFESNIDAMEVYTKLFDALLGGDDGNGFEISLLVEGVKS